MSRKSRGFHRPAGGAKHWVQLEHYLLGCPAWRDLTVNAQVCYIELKRRYNGKNNGELKLSSREAMAIIKAKSPNTGALAMQDLIAHGFIAVTEESSFNRKVQISTSYRITEAANDTPGASRIPTKEFLRWTPPLSELRPEIQKPVLSIGHDSPMDRTPGIKLNAKRLAQSDG